VTVGAISQALSLQQKSKTAYLTGMQLGFRLTRQVQYAYRL